jgi:hypothetical protein
MRGFLRLHSIVGLLLFAGWSVLVNARERLVPQRAAPSSPPTPQHAPPAAADRLLWN